MKKLLFIPLTLLFFSCDMSTAVEVSDDCGVAGGDNSSCGNSCENNLILNEGYSEFDISSVSYLKFSSDVATPINIELFNIDFESSLSFSSGLCVDSWPIQSSSITIEQQSPGDYFVKIYGSESGIYGINLSLSR